MQLTEIVVERIIHKLLMGQNYREGVLALINTEFLEFCIKFFKKVVDAKFNDQEIDVDWYKKHFLNPTNVSDDLIIHSGLNRKTITNSYGTANRKIVLEVTTTYYDELLASINQLAESDELEIELTIKFKGVSVDLNLSETLLLINTLAVKRAALRGGAWSTAGKQVELPLMLTLAKLYGVPRTNYALKGLTTESREVDFQFINRSGQTYECEVKLMGRGNPESADAVIARDTKIFIADTLSERNKIQLKQRGVYWVELRSASGYTRLFDILQEISVPCTPFAGNANEQLNTILPEVFEELTGRT